MMKEFLCSTPFIVMRSVTGSFLILHLHFLRDMRRNFLTEYSRFTLNMLNIVSCSDVTYSRNSFGSWPRKKFRVNMAGGIAH